MLWLAILYNKYTWHYTICVLKSGLFTYKLFTCLLSYVVIVLEPTQIYRYLRTRHALSVCRFLSRDAIEHGICHLSVRYKVVLCRNDWMSQAGFWHGDFLPPIPHCVLGKFGYVRKLGYSLWFSLEISLFMIFLM